MKRSLQAIGLLMLVLIAAWGARSYFGYKHATLPILGVVPEFSLLQLSEKPIGRADLRGAVWAVNFFFTSCPSVCPRVSAKIANVVRGFSSNPEVRFLSISVDPKNDTPQKLSEYAERFGADQKQWLFVFGDMAQVRNMAAGVMLDAGEDPDLHSTRVAIIDHQGQIRALVDTLDQDAEAQISRALSSVLAEHL